MNASSTDELSAASTPLEARYRRLLRWLPGSYRRDWEEEMVGTFLERMLPADPEEAEYVAYCGRPSLPEKASVLGLAVRTRLGGVEAPPRSFVWGEAVRLVALIGLLVFAAQGTIGILLEVWLAGGLPGPPVPESIAALADSPSALVVMGNLAWVVAFAALLLGYRATAKAVSVAAVLPVFATVVVSTGGLAFGGPAPGVHVAVMWVDLLLAGLVVAALAAFHRDAPSIRPRPWLLGYLAALPVLAGLTTLWALQPDLGLRFLDAPAVWAALVTATGVTHLRRSGASPPEALRWTLGLAMLAAVVAGIRLASLAWHLTMPATERGMALAAGIVEAVVVSVVAVALARRANRRLAQLSDAPAG